MKKFLIVTLLLATALISVGRAHAQTPTPITIGGAEDKSGGVGLPGSHDPNDPKEGGPIALVANLYDFALAAGGILAFGSILFGAVMYLTQPGNHEAQSSAKARIRDAFLGLLLLLGIYLILHTVNPALTKLQFPVLQRLNPPVGLALDPFSGQTIDPKAVVWACETNDKDNSLKVQADATYDVGGVMVTAFPSESDCLSQCNSYLENNKIIPNKIGYNYLGKAVGPGGLSAGMCEETRGAQYNALVVKNAATRATGHLSCSYRQSSGQLTCRDAKGLQVISEVGYSGTGNSKNNPDAQCLVGQGPIPQGAYVMSRGDDNAGHGPLVTALTPAPTNNMCGRAGFLIHGDNSSHDASEGCIIMGPATRQKIIDAGGGTLQVLR